MNFVFIPVADRFLERYDASMILQDFILATWLLGFVFLLPALPAPAAVLVLLFLTVLWSLAGLLLAKKPFARPRLSPSLLFLVAAGATLALHVMPWRWPVPSLSDDHLYVGLPAAIAFRLPLGAWILPVAGIAILAAALLRRLPAAWLSSLLFISGATSIALLAVSLPLVSPGMNEVWIYRYPPLMTSIYAAGYEAFGISEWWPGFVQYLFHALTVLVAARWLPQGRKPTLPALLLLFFAPSLFHFANTSAPTCGLLFVSLAAALLHFRYRANGIERDRHLLLGVTVFGAFYYQMFLFTLVFLAADAAIGAMTNRGARAREAKILVTHLLAGVAVAPFVFASGYYLELRDAGIRPGLLLTRPEGILWNFRTMAETYGYAGTLLLFLGGWHLLKTRPSERRFWLISFFGHLLLLSASGAAGMLRHTQPLYLPLLLGLFLLAEDHATTLFYRVATFLLALAFLGLALFSQAPQLRTFANLEGSTFQASLPYEPLIRGIDRISGGAPITVYAPMGTEPSHYYLMKTGAWGRIAWIRKPLLDRPVSTAELAAVLAEARAEFFVVPTTAAKNDFFAAENAAVAENAPFLSSSGVFSLGADTLLLYRVSAPIAPIAPNAGAGPLENLPLPHVAL